MSGIRPGTYTVTFSADKYTSAVATVTVEKIPTSITVKPSSLKLEVNDEVATGADLTAADGDFADNDAYLPRQMTNLDESFNNNPKLLKTISDLWDKVKIQ